MLRDTTAQRTTGGGVFLDLRPPTRRRRTPERMAQLDAATAPDVSRAFAALLDREPYFVDVAAFARDHALSAAQADVLAATTRLLPAAGGEIALSSAHFERLAQSLVAALAAYHAENPDLPGQGTERLRMQAAVRLPAPTFRALLQTLAAEGRVAVSGAWVRLPGHEVRLSAADETLLARVLPLLGGSERFRPPRVRDIAGILVVAETDVRRVLKLVGRAGKVDEIAHDHFFLRETVAEMTGIVADLGASGEKGQFTAAQFRDRVDNGRKVAIQILEFFDRHGVTLRRGDLRRINPHRIDLFGPVPARAA